MAGKIVSLWHACAEYGVTWYHAVLTLHRLLLSFPRSSPRRCGSCGAAGATPAPPPPPAPLAPRRSTTHGSRTSVRSC